MAISLPTDSVELRRQRQYIFLSEAFCFATTTACSNAAVLGLTSLKPNMSIQDAFSLWDKISREVNHGLFKPYSAHMVFKLNLKQKASRISVLLHNSLPMVGKTVLSDLQRELAGF